MRKTATLLTIAALLMTTGTALEATINPASPDEITLDGSNDYSTFKTFDGSGSTGEGLTYSWNNVDTTETDSGVEANFTFDRDGVQSNTIRLTVTNGTHSDVDEVTQVVRDVPNTTISADQTDVETGESVSLTASVTNAFDDPVTYAWNVEGTNESAGDSFTFSRDSSGDYDIQLQVTDDGGNTATSNTVTVSVSEPSTSTDDDSGGGGSIDVSPTPSVPQHAQVLGDLSPNERAVVDIDASEQETLGVRTISISVSNPANDVSITVTKQDGQPADVSTSVEGRAYRYMDIQAENLNESTTEEAQIQFDINKSWIEDNDINISTVRLERYTETWDRLPTEHIEETTDKHVFNATTPGFSYFAVAADETQDETTDDGSTTNDTAAMCGDGTCDANETWQDCPSDCEKPEEVLDAENAIQQAESTIAEGERGYDILQSARTAFDDGNYTGAADLAQQAQEEHTQAQESGGLPILPLLVVVIVGILAAIAYTRRDEIEDLLGSTGGSTGGGGTGTGRSGRSQDGGSDMPLGETFVEADRQD